MLGDWANRRGIPLMAVVEAIVAVFVVSLLAIVLGLWPPATAFWAVFAMTGQMTILSYAYLSAYFGSVLAGRANTALNLLVFLGAFAIQYAIGGALDFWEAAGGPLSRRGLPGRFRRPAGPPAPRLGLVPAVAAEIGLRLSVLPAHRIAAQAAAPKTAKAAVSGYIVPSKPSATAAPSGIEMKVESEETTAEPTPAIWPRGSIARAMRLPKRRPMQRNDGEQAGDKEPERRKPPEGERRRPPGRREERHRHGRRPDEPLHAVFRHEAAVCESMRPRWRARAGRNRAGKSAPVV